MILFKVVLALCVCLPAGARIIAMQISPPALPGLQVASVTGVGPNYASAYSAAAAQIPPGHQIIRVQSAQSGASWVVTIFFR